MNFFCDKKIEFAKRCGQYWSLNIWYVRISTTWVFALPLKVVNLNFSQQFKMVHVTLRVCQDSTNALSSHTLESREHGQSLTSLLPHPSGVALCQPPVLPYSYRTVPPGTGQSDLLSLFLCGLPSPQ